MENSMMVLWKIKHRIMPAIALLSARPKELKAGTRTDICTLVFRAALFTVAKRWKHLRHPSMDGWMDGWMDRMWCTRHDIYHICIDYYSALKRSAILTHATTWISLEDIMLCEICQTDKYIHSVIPLMWGVPGAVIVARGWGRVGRYCCWLDWSFSLRRWKSSGDGWWGWGLCSNKCAQYLDP